MYEITNGNIVAGVNYQVTGTGGITYNSSVVSAGSWFVGLNAKTTYTVASGVPKVYESTYLDGLCIHPKSDFFLGLFTDETNLKGLSIITGERYRLEVVPDIEKLINIKFRDFQGWRSVAGKPVNWDKYNDYLQESNLHPRILQPEIITDTWGGVKIDVQLIKWQGWFTEFIISEAQIHDLEQLLSCSDVLINDVTNEISHIADASNSEYLELEIVQISNSTKYLAKLKYRTDKTVINKHLPINNIYTLTSDFYNQTTDFDLVYNQEESKQTIFENDSGVGTLTNSILKKTVNMLFYLTESQKNNLIKEYENTENNYIQLKTYETQGAKFVSSSGLDITFDSDVSDVKKGQKIKLSNNQMIVQNVSTYVLTVDNINDPNVNIGTDLLKSEIIDIISPNLIKSESIGEQLYKCEVNGQIE